IAGLLQLSPQLSIEAFLLVANNCLIAKDHTESLRFREIDFGASRSGGCRERCRCQAKRVFVDAFVHSSLKNVGDRASKSIFSVVAEGNWIHAEFSSIDRATYIGNFSKGVVQNIIQFEDYA